MYLISKFGGRRFYGNVDFNSYINSYMNTSEKAKLTASVCHIERFSKSRIPIYHSEGLDTAGRKTTIRAQATAKRYAFYVFSMC